MFNGSVFGLKDGRGYSSRVSGCDGDYGRFDRLNKFKSGFVVLVASVAIVSSLDGTPEGSSK